MKETSSSKELQALIGNIICRAFLDDQEFRERLKPVNRQLEELCPFSPENPTFFALSAFNSYLVSSFHAAQAIDLLASEARARIGREGMSELMLVQHAFALQAVLQLNCARSFVGHQPVKDFIGADAHKKVLDSFDAHFGNLKLARDALAHEDERVLGIVERKSLVKDLKAIDAVDFMQFTRLDGPVLTVKDKTGKDLILKFPVKNYIALVVEIDTTLRELVPRKP